jgi:hypothetical protein
VSEGLDPSEITFGIDAAQEAIAAVSAKRFQANKSPDSRTLPGLKLKNTDWSACMK